VVRKLPSCFLAPSNTLHGAKQIHTQQDVSFIGWITFQSKRKEENHDDFQDEIAVEGGKAREDHILGHDFKDIQRAVSGIHALLAKSFKATPFPLVADVLSSDDAVQEKRSCRKHEGIPVSKMQHGYRPSVRRCNGCSPCQM